MTKFLAGLKILLLANVDGTFKSASEFYHQLWIINSWINLLMMPCAYVFMSQRRVKDYKIALQVSKNVARLLGLKFKPN